MAPRGRLGRIMRVECVGGATWEEAMPPLAPSDRSPMATPEVPTIPKSSFLVVCFKYMDVAVAYRLNL